MRPSAAGAAQSPPPHLVLTHVRLGAGPDFARYITTPTDTGVGGGPAQSWPTAHAWVRVRGGWHTYPLAMHGHSALQGLSTFSG